MRNFQLIATGVDPLPMVFALHRHPELWNADRFRTTYPHTPHGEVDDILIRFSDPAQCNTVSTVIGDDRPIWHPAASVLPFQPIVLDLMRRMGAYALDRCMVTRLRPGARIKPHADDQGDYVNAPDRARFHVVLQGLPGSLYHNGEETVQMLSGQVWSFNPLLIHSVENNSADDRLHLIADLCLMPVC
jgi:aspartyl/asparaginyl beta-hydroxylase